MPVTLLLSLVLIASIFGALCAAVGLIQKNTLFTTAPKDIQAAAKEHPERFPGQHALGWMVALLCVGIALGTFVYGGWNGVQNGFSFWQFFLRFLVMLYLWKGFDIVCLDWLLLTKSHFFQHFYPETKGCAGYHSFGFNRKEQLTRLAVFPFVAAALAGICLLF